MENDLERFKKEKWRGLWQLIGLLTPLLLLPPIAYLLVWVLTSDYWQLLGLTVGGVIWTAIVIAGGWWRRVRTVQKQAENATVQFQREVEMGLKGMNLQVARSKDSLRDVAKLQTERFVAGVQALICDAKRWGADRVKRFQEDNERTLISWEASAHEITKKLRSKLDTVKAGIREKANTQCEALQRQVKEKFHHVCVKFVNGQAKDAPGSASFAERIATRQRGSTARSGPVPDATTGRQRFATSDNSAGPLNGWKNQD